MCPCVCSHLLSWPNEAGGWCAVSDASGARSIHMELVGRMSSGVLAAWMSCESQRWRQLGFRVGWPRLNGWVRELAKLNWRWQLNWRGGGARTHSRLQITVWAALERVKCYLHIFLLMYKNSAASDSNIVSVTAVSIWVHESELPKKYCLNSHRSGHPG